MIELSGYHVCQFLVNTNSAILHFAVHSNMYVYYTVGF